MATSARIDELKKRFDENPRRFFAPLANEYRKAGDLEQAIALCRQHLADQPGNLNGQIVFGQALFDSGEHAEARAAFESAIELDPENLIALRHLGDIARGFGEIDTARGWYQRVLDADPRNEEIAGFLKELDALAIADTVLTDVAPTAAPAAPAPTDPAPIALASVAPEAPAAHAPPPPAAPIALEPMIPEVPASAPDLSTAKTVEFAPPPVLRPTPVLPVAALEPPVEDDNPRRRSSDLLDLDAVGLGDLPPADPIAPTAAAAAPDLDIAGWDEPAATADDAAAFNAPEPPPESAFGAEFTLDAPAEIAPPADVDVEPPPAPAAAVDDLGFEPTDAFAAPVTSAAPPPPAPTPPQAADLVALFGDGGFSGAAVDLPDAPEPEFVRQVEPETVTAGGAVSETPQAFVTETMAELYLQQGFRDQALEVYRQLLAQNPHDAGLAERVHLLESGGRASLAVAAVDDRVIEHAAVHAGEETARAFFRRLADRGLNGAAGAVSPSPPTPDAPMDGIGPAATPVAGPMVTPAAPTPLSVAAQVTPRGGGTLDALFGGVAAPADEQAAAALAGAFGSPVAEPVAPPSGRATRQASDDFSLDRVFRGETARSSGTAPTPRASEALRFDQFFASHGEPAPGAPADGANTPTDAGDLQQFQSWLTGLKGPQ